MPNGDYWWVGFFARHPEDDEDQSVPAFDFLMGCPLNVRKDLMARFKSVAEAPPLKFSGGGYWEKMRGDMSDYYELKKDGDRHYRIFCLLEDPPPGHDEPAIAAVCGMSKDLGTTFSEAEYAAVRELGDEYQSRNPRRLSPIDLSHF